ncbi:MAG: ferritin-like domain-containing protein [Geminicoccaceae bacterium]
MSDAMRARKLFPRNATARSHHWVTGNPVTTRPESGVDNCYPGLEFDQRNLDKRFIPGLEFELHRSAVLRTIDAGERPELAEISQAELARGLVLKAINGTFGEERDGSRRHTVGFEPDGALDDWRMVHDLEPGPVAIALGPLNGGFPLNVILGEFEGYLASGSDQPVVERQGDGSFLFAFLKTERAIYLNDDGVIDPAGYRPGDLTRSLCSPWQYDFALCGCFYWASNKPDMVQKDADSPQFSNFQRSRTGGEDPVEPVADYPTWQRIDIGEPEMINVWEQLPAVFDAVERNGTPVAAVTVLPDSDVLARAEVIRALRELATIEHGLMVEYLYAYYSIDQNAFAVGSADERRVRSAADTVLSVAIDEMRHLRWVNEMLLDLGEPYELGRFETLPDVDRDGRFLDHSFSLKRLSPDRLEWFITVEAPSDQIDVEGSNMTIDGMYTRLLLSISQGSEFNDEEKRRLVHLIKLIIDEGFDHFQRFTRVQSRLAGLDPERYLRLPDDPAPQPQSDIVHVFETVADAAYAQVIKLLAFALTPENRGGIDALILGAREIMYNLDEAARTAAANGGAPLFRLPVQAELEAAFTEEGVLAMAADDAMSPADFIEQQLAVPMRIKLADLEAADNGAALAKSIERRFKTVRERFERLQ